MFPTICIFTHDGRPEIEVTEFIQKIMVSRPEGWQKVRYKSYCGNSMLPHVRNAAVSNFLNEVESTDLIFIDCDNVTDEGGLQRLLSHNVDLVGAPIIAKQDDPIKWNCRWLKPIQRELNGLIEVESVGTGILRMSRRCVETMRDAVKNDWYYDRWSDTGKAWNIFKYRIEANEWFGEDVVFCVDWRRLGGKVYVDPDITTHHIGRKSYTANLTKFLTDRPLIMSAVSNPESIVNTLSKDYNGSLPLHSEPRPAGAVVPVLVNHNEQLPAIGHQNGSGAGHGRPELLWDNINR